MRPLLSIVVPDDRTKAGQHVEIEHWFASLRRRWVLFVAVVVGCMALGAVLTVVQEPVYKATAEVALGPSAGAAVLGAAEDAPGLASELKAAQNAAVEKLVDRRLGDGTRTVAVTGDEASMTLTFVASADTAQESADVANAYAQAYVDARKQRTEAEYDAALTRLRDKLADVDEQLVALSPPPADADSRAILQAQRTAYLAAIDQLEVASTVGGASSARVIEAAEPPAGRSSPLLRDYLAYSLVAGLVLGAGVVGVVEFLDRSVRGVAGARAAAGGVPVLGRVRRKTSSGVRRLLGDRLGSSGGEEPASGSGVLLIDAPTSAEAEDYRSLRTTALSMLDTPHPFVQVTSTSAEDGATVVAANLAAAIARTGEPTVLVSLAGLEGLDLPLAKIKRRDPLTAFLTGAAPAECMAPVLGFDNLTVIAGQDGSVPNDDARGSISAALKGLQSLSRTVVLLSPPMLGSAHALEVSQLVGTLLVVKDGSTPAADLAEASRSLELMDALVLGVVLT